MRSGASLPFPARPGFTRADDCLGAGFPKFGTIP
jgi:hypothetical protein